MSLLDPAPPITPLSLAMREGSQAAHTEAESSAFMAELTSARVNAFGVRDYLLRFREVYRTMELLGTELSADPAVAAVVDPALDRLPAIEQDLAYWAEVAGAPAPAVFHSPATDAYVARLLEVRAWAPLFVAHHYTRYLGDLSGGQVIGRVLDRELGLEGRGTAFYAFPAIPKPKPYKDGYRARLDALGLTPEQRAAVVGEVSVAFNLNQAIFTELGEDMAGYRR
ncbi:heme oxygenase (biliverdin-producing) [Nocardioides hwasunensis]|uniref:Biliverdin-producing heme oxygenase n=1 Tax=Nocardioides hwasunensis TaxID=397258 RepID=A0ABR8MG13_9ACTN|nr:biliverdin-producing heme oxygenase [Nocardioides hwasunensis]MBD3914206.1 biliverdin-producing heme oxygenase [Nocardioides hwasunensis]